MTKSTPEKFKTIERDISWMYFNKRILDEAADKNNPLLERLKFIGIYSNNLDEFFRVRVATLRRMIEIDKSVKKIKSDSEKILRRILKLNEIYSLQIENIFLELIDGLKKEKIYFVNEHELNEEQIAFIERYYNDVLMSNLYPVLVSRMQNKPTLSDKNIYLAVQISKLDINLRRKKELALIKIPTTELSRFVQIPSAPGTHTIMFLDDVIRYCLPKIFVSLNYDSYEAYTIKFTRDSEMDFDKNDYQSLLEKVSKAVKSRKKGEPIRFVYDRDIPIGMLRSVEKYLNIERGDAHVASSRYHNLKDLIDFPKLGRSDLEFKPQPPLPSPEFDNAISTIELIRQKDRLLHYPYQRFDNFIRLLREAAISPEVKEIKISLYRLAKNSKIIKALINAAMNGKAVTANLELLARFDESSNINWAQKMKDAGINVIFGVEGLKTHSKLALIKTRRKSVVCISTGNFHEGTAQVYTDVTLMTANPMIVEDVKKVFEFIEHPYTNQTYKELIVSPNYTRKKILLLISKEISNIKKGLPAYIFMKINHLVDEKIIRKLYQASNAGVKIRLLVRGNCSVITGIKNMSENIEIYGILDRYLEHERILIFANGGNEKYYIGSADLMVRNLDNRIEVFTPVYDRDLQKYLRLTIEYGLKDNVKSRVVDGSGNNFIHDTNSNIPFRSQEEIYNYYKSVLK